MYKPFKIEQLFEIISNPQLDKENFVFSDKAEYPYFTRTENNNGILGYVEYLDNEHMIKGNSLAVGMISMKFHYMSHDFYAGQFTKTLIPKFGEFDETLALYFINILNKYSSYYQSYLVREFVARVNNTICELPIIENANTNQICSVNDIDWDCIKDYIRKLEKERIRELEDERVCELDAYLNATGLNDCELTNEEKQIIKDVALNSGAIRWNEFPIGDLFDIATGRDVIIREMQQGMIPLVSHQNTDNGIVMYVQPISDRRIFNHNNTISLADRGLFWATIQDKDFHIGTRVKALTLKKVVPSKRCLIFLACAINKLQVLFAEYLTNATDKLPYLPISLPVKTTGEPDWDFMEKYIRAIEKLVITDVVKLKDQQIEMTRKVVNQEAG